MEIKVSNCELKLVFRAGHNDMSHYFPSKWEVPDYYLLEEEFFNKLVAFENCTKTDFKELNQQLKINPSLVWEYNAHHKNGIDWVRYVAILGEPSLVRLSNLEVYIKRPILVVIAYILNIFRKYKVIAEIKEWELK